jgi:hypothetical protein
LVANWYVCQHFFKKKRNLVSIMKRFC